MPQPSTIAFPIHGGNAMAFSDFQDRPSERKLKLYVCGEDDDDPEFWLWNPMNKPWAIVWAESPEQARELARVRNPREVLLGDKPRVIHCEIGC